MSLQTLNDILLVVCKNRRERVMLQKRASGWVPISSAEIYRNVVGVARALESWGIDHGDRVAILSENRPEWTITDFAALALGAVTVPIYSTQTADQTSYILNDSGARVIAVSTKSQLEKILAIQRHTALERIIVMDAVETAHAVPMSQLMLPGPPGLDPEIGDAPFDARSRAILPDDLATIIYTSGTTGTPKGVMLTHGNMASNLNVSLDMYDIDKDDLCVSFLPLSHVTARHLDYALFNIGAPLAYCPNMDDLPRAMAEVHPTIIVAVPRVYEKIYNKVHYGSHGLKHALIKWALSVGVANREAILRGETPKSIAWKLANALVFSKVRAGLGGRARIFVSGGAPLGREIATWYADIGIRIHEGYGLTETSPVIAVNNPINHRLGTVGKPLPNVEVRIAEDGELLVRGPSVFKGYWKMPQESAAVFEDGWFKTGDIANLDAEGYLSITDRKKDLIKTSGGKFIAPQPIESSLKVNQFIGEAALLGDMRRFPAVLIIPSFPDLEEWARHHNVKFSTRKELIKAHQVQSLYQGIVDEMNQNLAQYEKLKRVLVVPDELSIADGTLTPSMKLRRRNLTDRYKKEIDALYADAESHSRDTIPAKR